MDEGFCCRLSARKALPLFIETAAVFHGRHDSSRTVSPIWSEEARGSFKVFSTYGW
jgi:hypothetical protein